MIFLPAVFVFDCHKQIGINLIEGAVPALEDFYIIIKCLSAGFTSS